MGKRATAGEGGEPSVQKLCRGKKSESHPRRTLKASGGRDSGGHRRPEKAGFGRCRYSFVAPSGMYFRGSLRSMGGDWPGQGCPHEASKEGSAVVQARDDRSWA